MCTPPVREWGKGVSKPSSLLQAPHKHKLSAGNYEIRGRASLPPLSPKARFAFSRGVDRYYGAFELPPRAEEEHPSPPPPVKRKLRGPANCYIHPIRLIAELRLLLLGGGPLDNYYPRELRQIQADSISPPPSPPLPTVEFASVRTSKFLLSPLFFFY